MNAPQIKPPEGFCRVSEITKNNSDQNALYDAVAAKQIPHARLCTGHSSIVFVHRESALGIVARREHRRSSQPVVIPAETTQPPPESEKDISIKELRLHMNECLRKVWEAQNETNRLLGEVLKVWGAGK